MARVRVADPQRVHFILCLSFASGGKAADIAELKQALISDDRIMHSVDTSGAFDFMCEATVASLADYRSVLDELSVRYDHLIDRYEACFICRRYVRTKGDEEKYLWVPDHQGLRRVDHDQIDKVEAEGDYVRIHSGEQHWLLHATMKGLMEQLGDDHFVQVNRSLIVRCDFVERLIHVYHRWKVRLADGSEDYIARARASQVIDQLKLNSDGVGKQNGSGGEASRPILLQH